MGKHFNAGKLLAGLNTVDDHVRAFTDHIDANPDNVDEAKGMFDMVFGSLSEKHQHHVQHFIDKVMSHLSSFAAAATEGASIISALMTHARTTASTLADIDHPAAKGFEKALKVADAASNIVNAAADTAQTIADVASTVTGKEAEEVEAPVVAEEVEAPVAAEEVEAPVAAEEVEDPVAAEEVEAPVAIDVITDSDTVLAGDVEEAAL